MQKHLPIVTDVARCTVITRGLENNVFGRVCVKLSEFSEKMREGWPRGGDDLPASLQ